MKVWSSSWTPCWVVVARGLSDADRLKLASRLDSEFRLGYHHGGPGWLMVLALLALALELPLLAARLRGGACCATARRGRVRDVLTVLAVLALVLLVVLPALDPILIGLLYPRSARYYALKVRWIVGPGVIVYLCLRDFSRFGWELRRRGLVNGPLFIPWSRVSGLQKIEGESPALEFHGIDSWFCRRTLRLEIQFDHRDEAMRR